MKIPSLLDERLPALEARERHAAPAIAGVPRLYMASQRADAVYALTDEDALFRVSFDAEAPQAIEVDREFLDQASGGVLRTLGPASWSRELSYLQSRRLVLYDTEERTCEIHDVTDSANLEELAVDGLWLRPEPRTLVVQIEDTTRYEEGLLDHRLRSFELTGGGLVERGVLELGTSRSPSFVWGAGGGVVVVVQRGGFEAFGSDLARPVSHPLQPLLERIVARGEALVGLRIHPERGLAVCALADAGPIGGRTFQVWSVCWDVPGVGELLHVATAHRASRLQLGELSPEGDWVVIRVDAAEASRFYLQRIGGAPGEARAMGAVVSPVAACWMRAPLAYVIFDAQGRIHRWRVEAGGAASP